MGEPSHRERVAFEVVRRVLGAEVRHHDTDGRQRAVDGLIVYEDGRHAALEVTTLTDQAAHEVENLLAAEDFTWALPGCAWWWTVQVPRSADLRTLRKRLPAFLRWCEAHGVVDPYLAALHGLPGGDQWSRWFDEIDVSLHGHPEQVTRAGTAMVSPRGTRGAVGDAAAIVGWLTEELRAARTQRKVAKLLDSGLDETHLFLIVDHNGAPFTGYHALAFGEDLPVNAPDTAGLSSVWLAPRWSRGVLRYDQRLGWARHEPYDTPSS